MLADIEAGKVGVVLAKDMSRIGRDYLQTGFYTEILFREKVSASSLSATAWTARTKAAANLFRFSIS